MSREEYMKYHNDFCEKLKEITKIKNNDYSGHSEDPFANFRVVEDSNITSTEIGFLTRMMDKISRLNSFIKKGELQVKDESVEDTLMDLANYCILMSGYIKSRNFVEN